MDCDSIDENMTDITIILPLIAIEENIEEVNNGNDERKNINNHYYQRIDKHSFGQSGKRIDCNK
jgi:hypothetical protein